MLILSTPNSSMVNQSRSISLVNLPDCGMHSHALHLETSRIPLHTYAALISARVAASWADVAPPLEAPPVPMLLLGAGLGAESCVDVVIIRESNADQYQRVSQQSDHARPKPLSSKYSITAIAVT